MSKKIAQLTKVIYHLNTKNDEHEFQLQTLADSYEREIEDVVSRASKQIVRYRDLFEQERNEGRVNQIVTSLESQYTEEQTRVLEEFTRAKSDMMGRVRKLGSELDSLRQRHQERMRYFETRTKGWEEQSVQLKEHHETEIEELVRTSNAKYNKMVEKFVRESDSSLQKHSLEVAALRDEMTRERDLAVQDAVRSAHAEGQDDLARDQTLWRRKVEDGQEEVRRLRLVENNLKLEIEKLVKSARANDDLVLKLRGDIKSLTSQLEGSRKLVLDWKNQLHQEKTLREQESQSFENELLELRSQLASKENLSRDLRKRVDDLGRKNGSQKSALRQSAERLDHAKSEIERLENDLFGAKRELDRQTDLGSKNVRELDETMRRLRDENRIRGESLQNRHEKEIQDLRLEMSEALSNRDEKFLRDIADIRRNADGESAKALRDQKAEMLAEFAVEKAALGEELNTAVAESDSLKAQLERLNSELTDASFDSERGRNQLLRRIAKLQHDKDGVIHDLTIQIEKQQSAHKADSLTLNSKIQKLETQLDQAREDAHQTLSNWEADKEKLSASELLNTKMKRSISALEELTQKRLRLSEDEKEKALSALRERVSASSEQALQLRLQSLRESMERAAEERLEKEKAAAEEEKAAMELEWSSRLGEMEDELEKQKTHHRTLRESIRKLNEDHRSETDELQVKHEERVAEVEAAHRSDLASKRRNWEDEVTELRRALAQDKDEMYFGYEKKIRELNDKSRSLVKSLKMEAERKKEASLAELSEQKERDAEKCLTRLREELMKEKSVLEDQLRKNKSIFQATVEKRELIIAEQRTEILGLKQELGQESNHSVSLRDQLSNKDVEIARMQQDFVARMGDQDRRLKQEQEEALDSLRETHAERIDRVKEEMERHTDAWEAREKGFRSKIRSLELRYENRESRPEDLQQIRFLERRLLDSEKGRQKSEQERDRYKLEVIQREDVLSRCFGTTPIVGQINPRARAGSGIVTMPHMPSLVRAGRPNPETGRRKERFPYLPRGGSSGDLKNGIGVAGSRVRPRPDGGSQVRRTARRTVRQKRFRT